MSVDVADFDRDGDPDVVVGEHNLAIPDSSRLFIFENLDGKGGSWARHLVYTGDEHHDGAQAVDIDGDGDLDIVSIGWTHGKVLLYENLALTAQEVVNNFTANPWPLVTGSGRRLRKTKVCPESFALYQNSPNPFNPTTTGSDQVRGVEHVKLTVVWDRIGGGISILDLW